MSFYINDFMKMFKSNEKQTIDHYCFEVHQKNKTYYFYSDYLSIMNQWVDGLLILINKLYI